MGRVHFLLLSSLGIPSLCPFQRGRKREERLRLCSRWPMGLLLGWGIEGGQGRRWQGEADLLPTSQSASWGQNTLSLTLSTRHPAPHKGCQGHRSTLSARAGLGGGHRCQRGSQPVYGFKACLGQNPTPNPTPLQWGRTFRGV